jgi:hypothetical protein
MKVVHFLLFFLISIVFSHTETENKVVVPPDGVIPNLNQPSNIFTNNVGPTTGIPTGQELSANKGVLSGGKWVFFNEKWVYTMNGVLTLISWSPTTGGASVATNSVPGNGVTPPSNVFQNNGVISNNGIVSPTSGAVVGQGSYTVPANGVISSSNVIQNNGVISNHQGESSNGVISTSGALVGQTSNTVPANGVISSNVIQNTGVISTTSSGPKPTNKYKNGLISNIKSLHSQVAHMKTSNHPQFQTSVVNGKITRHHPKMHDALNALVSLRDELISEQNHMLAIVNLENQKHQNALELASMMKSKVQITQNLVSKCQSALIISQNEYKLASKHIANEIKVINQMISSVAGHYLSSIPNSDNNINNVVISNPPSTITPSSGSVIVSNQQNNDSRGNGVISTSSETSKWKRNESSVFTSNGWSKSKETVLVNGFPAETT